MPKRLSALRPWGMLLLMAAPQAWGDFSQRISADPSLSHRCRKLSLQREEKVQKKQKLMELIARNHGLFKRTPHKKQSVLRLLRNNYGPLKRELRLALIQIQMAEEQLVRGGCPGVKL